MNNCKNRYKTDTPITQDLYHNDNTSLTIVFLTPGLLVVLLQAFVAEPLLARFQLFLRSLCFFLGVFGRLGADLLGSVAYVFLIDWNHGLAPMARVVGQSDFLPQLGKIDVFLPRGLAYRGVGGSHSFGLGGGLGRLRTRIH